MEKLLLLLTFLSLPLSGQYNKKGLPTSNGIDDYVKVNQNQFVMDYQKFINDSIYDAYFYTDKLDENPNELGCFYVPNEIVITNEEKFTDYRITNLSKRKRNNYILNNQFVYATAMHELTHLYFYQVMVIMKQNEQYVYPAYLKTISLFPTDYGQEFIEEGLCEYIVYKMGETITNDYQPKNINEINKSFDIKYRYSSLYVRAFVDKHGLKTAMQMILGNKPPSNEEIMYPMKYFNRLIPE